jgi:hypothetical protein
MPRASQEVAAPDGSVDWPAAAQVINTWPLPALQAFLAKGRR